MSQASDELHQRLHEADARQSLRRPEEYGSIPGAVPVRGPLLSWCCDAPVLGGIYNVKGIRTGLCSKCCQDSTFREDVPSIVNR